MCGIFGYVGKKPCVQNIFKGLSVLEYRGYDSAGIAVLHQNKISCAKAEGKLSSLQPKLSELPPQATVGMGHTRWATHGAPTTPNAHPHVTDGMAIIHNGIIENYASHKKDLLSKGTKFLSETDSEVLLHLLAKATKAHHNDTKKAIVEILPQLKGAFAVAIISEHEPETIYLIKKGSPIAVGLGTNENFFASDALSLMEHTNKAIFLNDGEIARLTPHGVDFWNFNGEEIKRVATQLQWSETSIEKKGFRHFMLKEIHDQPGVVASTVRRIIDFEKNSIRIEALGLGDLDLKRIKNIQIVACGTAHYAAAVSRYFLESNTKIPVNVELAHEFRYRAPLMDASYLLIAVSQSGETADTLACVGYAKEKGAQTFAICNVQHSSIPRESQARLYMEAGPEIGVASTKAFTSMILNMYLLSLGIAEERGFKDPGRAKVFEELKSLPFKLEQAIDSFDSIDRLAYTYTLSKSVLYLGRGMNFPLAFEGALKLKEISYIHAEGFAGGELKHGPIALVDRSMPIVALVPQDSYYEKMLSNVEEVVARHGRVIGIGAPDDKRLQDLCADYIMIPQTSTEALQALITAVPLQMFAYCAAVHRGTDVDQPRNLAKSVTVE